MAATTPAICLYKDCATNLPAALEYAETHLCGVLITPIVNPHFCREFERQPMKQNHIRFARSDLLLEPIKWANKIVAKLSDSIDCDSADENVRKNSIFRLKQEVAFAQHLAGQGCVLVRLHDINTVNLARTISAELQGTLLVEVPMINPKIQVQSYRKGLGDRVDTATAEDTWQWWNKFRAYADYNCKFQVALEMSADLPSHEEILRWLGEPIEILVIPSDIFVMNKNNYPVLSKAHKAVALQFLQIRSKFAVKACAGNDNSLLNYVQYLQHLNQENDKKKDPMLGYDDLLEIPLQPLYDNLDSYTYEIFEKDPIKYIYYQKAIEMALIDKVPEKDIKKRTIIVMVVGAGRGPLVRSAINASTNTRRKIKIFVIEKNPNAIVTLCALKEELWSNKDITIIPTDMRDFVPTEKADIIVSELLGSFGDNELSPECLDGAQNHLKSDGISIPCLSTSYINPVMSPKLLNAIRDVRPNTYRQKPNTYEIQSESSYVVYFKNSYHIARAQAVFTFEHPNRREILDNSRYAKLRFNVDQDCVMNGFAGYFDTVLYKDIKLSIHPETHSTGLSSWFSMYFPLAEPQQLRAGDILEVNFWRCVSENKVWYEWNTTAPIITHIHNSKGRACPIYK